MTAHNYYARYSKPACSHLALLSSTWYRHSSQAASWCARYLVSAFPMCCTLQASWWIHFDRLHCSHGLCGSVSLEGGILDQRRHFEQSHVQNRRRNRCLVRGICLIHCHNSNISDTVRVICMIALWRHHPVFLIDRQRHFDPTYIRRQH